MKALVAFFKRTEDNACVEDVMHMIIRALCDTAFLVSFIQQIELLGGCQLFLGLLDRYAFVSTCKGEGWMFGQN